jgi:outer membrane receptor for ferrienterochelin and colicin
MTTLTRPSVSLAAFLAIPVLLLSGCAGSSSGWGSRASDAPRASLYLLTAEQIRDYPSARSIEDLLEQHFAGFAHRTPDERPGASGDLYLLGAASPLVVIDGVPVQTRGSIGVNPQDVERIELVKYGASAMYGFRGSAGAILITTRRN